MEVDHVRSLAKSSVQRKTATIIKRHIGVCKKTQATPARVSAHVCENRPDCVVREDGRNRRQCAQPLDQIRPRIPSPIRTDSRSAACKPTSDVYSSLSKEKRNPFTKTHGFAERIS